MLGGVATRERTCPACDASVRDRSARWCGSCGAPLEPPADDLTTTRTPSRPWRRRLVGAAAVAVVTGVVLTGGGLVERASRTATVDDPAVAGPDEDALGDLPRGRPPEPSQATEPTCSEGPRHDCFAWIVETGEDPHFGSSVKVGGFVISRTSAAGRITAYDLHDGTPAWTAEADPSADGSSSLQVAADLVVHHADGVLVARDVASGEERWRNPQLVAFDPHRVVQHEDVLLLAGFQARLFPAAGPIEPGHAVAAVDAATGELRWHQSGSAGAALASGGTGVLLDGGRLRAHASDGTLRWEVDAGTAESRDPGIWVVGHAISVRGGSDPSRLHRLGDGAPLPFAADPLVHDEQHTLLVTVEPDDEGTGYTLGDEYILLDETGEVWRAPAPAQHCFGPVQFQATTVTLTSCDGETIVLHRADGAVVSRTSPADDGRSERSASYSVGNYELFRDGGVLGGDDLVVADRRTDTEIARLPSDTWPVDDAGRGWEPHRDGVLVLEGHGWLVALEVPGPVPAGRDTGSTAG